MKNYMVKRSFALFVALLLSATITFALILFTNQVSAENNDELVVSLNANEMSKTVIVNNVQNFITAEQAKGISNIEIGKKIFKTMGYNAEELSNLSNGDLLSLISSEEIMNQQIMFEVNEQGKATPTALSASNWEEEGIDNDVLSKGYLKCTFQVTSNYLYDINDNGGHETTQYNKKDKIRIADHFGYVINTTWEWLKMPMNRKTDGFFVSWDTSKVEIQPGYYDREKMRSIIAEYKSDDLFTPMEQLIKADDALSQLDSYCYSKGITSKGKIGTIYLCPVNPIGIEYAFFSGLDLPQSTYDIATMQIKSRIIVVSKENRIQDFLIHTEYGHAMLLFSGSISIQGTNVSASIQKQTGLDIYSTNARYAHVAPIDGWTYA